MYASRRRIHGDRGSRLLRRRGEYVERSFAHVYDTGGMRRTHLRGHTNILKRLLIHASAFNLGLMMRSLIGIGTPRGLQGRLAAVIALLAAVWCIQTNALTATIACRSLQRRSNQFIDSISPQMVAC